MLLKKITIMFSAIFLICLLSPTVFALSPAYVSNFSIIGSSEIIMHLGETITIEAEATPEGLDYAYITWFTDDGSVVNLNTKDKTIKLNPPISSVEITALKPGGVTITAYVGLDPTVDNMWYEASDSIKITVIENPNGTNKITADKVYDESFGQNNMLLVTASLGSYNGNKIIMVGDKELYYNSQRDMYIGLVDSSNVNEGKTLTSVSVIDGTPTTFAYGNLVANSSDEANISDLHAMKLIIEKNILPDERFLIASDLNDDGKCNISDLQAMKQYIEMGIEFPVLN